MGSEIKVLTLRLHEDATLPEIQTEGAAGFDLTSVESLTINPGARALIKTGIAVELPKGAVGMICSRSGLAANYGVFVLNAPGIIDSDYRGEIGVILFNSGINPFSLAVGDRIAQFLTAPVYQPTFEGVDVLTDTERGAGGFGSTGTTGK